MENVINDAFSLDLEVASKKQPYFSKVDFWPIDSAMPARCVYAAIVMHLYASYYGNILNHYIGEDMTLKRRGHSDNERRQKYGVSVYPSLMERVRDYAAHKEITVVRIIDDALTEYLDSRTEGKKIPKRTGELQRGARAS